MKLRIEKAIHGGAGLGRAPEEVGGSAGKAVFVPLTLPGELVECEIADDRRGFAHARLSRVLEPATARVAPACEYFPTCGGCHYQHASYAAQLEIKRAVLAETLFHAGVPVKADTIATLAGEPLGYRNRIRLHVRFGDFALCYREAGSHRDLPVDRCPIAAPLLQRALRAFPEMARSAGVATGLFDEAEWFTDARQDTLLLSLWTTQGAAATRALPVLCEALREVLPELRGALLFQVETRKGQGRQQAAWGDPYLIYRVGERDYRCGAGSFFQVNRFLLPELVELVTAGQSGESAWDLYAGVGLFAGALAGAFARVTAVEAAASSVRDLRENLKGGVHRVVASTTLDFLKARARDGKVARPELVVVDPPRAGLGKEVTALLSQIGPPRLIYISCDPATLARDLRALLHSGYHLRKTMLVDLFPQTFHIETVAELTRD